MSDKGQPDPTATAAPAAAPASEAAPAAAPAPAEGAAPQAQPEPSAQPQPEGGAKPDVKPESGAPGDEPTFLETAETGEAKKPDAEKPGDKKPDEKAGEVKAEGEQQAPQFEFQPYTMPEGFKADQEKLTEFNTVVADSKLTPQERGQKLIDLYTTEVGKLADQMLANQVRVFGDTRKQWRREIAQDPEMGGAGLKTTENAVARMRDLFVPEQDMAAFKSMLKITGAGDHPAFIRMMRNMARRFDEPSPVTPNFKPPADIGIKPKSAAGRRGVMYDHANSVARREGG